MQLSAKQKRVMKRLATGEDFFTLLEGSIRSGKSYSALLSFIIYTQAKHPTKNHIIAGRNLTVMKAELLNEIEKFVLGLGGTCKYTQQSGILTVNSTKYLVIAGHDEQSYKRVQSLTAHSALIDEVALVPENFLEQVIARLTYKDSIIVATCNPEGTSHWLKKNWIDKGKINARERFFLDDNPVLSDEVKERYNATFTGVFHQRNIKGEWAQAQGLIYRDFATITDNIKEHHIKFRDIGGDYGIKGTTAFVTLAYLHDGRCMVENVGGNFAPDDGVKTDEELADLLIDYIGNTQKIERLYIDPSASSLIATLRQKRLPLRVVAADNSVLSGISLIMNNTKAKRLLLGKKDLSALRDELGSYQWDKTEKDKPVKKDDHYSDALRYAYYTRNKRVAKGQFAIPTGL